MGKDIRFHSDAATFVIIVSGYAWEGYFSDDLANTIENCGGFLIKEFTHLASSRFGNATTQTDF